MRRRMTPDPTQPPPATPQSAKLPSEAFHTTRWSRVGEAKVESPEGERALTELCDAYYKPVAAFLRCETRDTDAEHGDQTALAARCGMNANALKVAVHRMKRRFRETLKAEIAGTLDEAGSVDEEMRALFAALGT